MELGTWREWQRQYKAGEKPSEVSLRRQLNTIKRDQFPWMFDVTKCAVQEAIIDLGTAFRAFFEKRGRYPRFKHKDSQAVLLRRQRGRHVSRRRQAHQAAGHRLGADA